MDDRRTDHELAQALVAQQIKTNVLLRSILVALTSPSPQPAPPQPADVRMNDGTSR